MYATHHHPREGGGGHISNLHQQEVSEGSVFPDDFVFFSLVYLFLRMILN